MKKVAVISGGRAEAGLLFGLMKSVRQHPSLKLQVYVTGMHLSEQFGNTWQEFAQQNIEITEKLNLDLDSTDNISNCRAIGQGITLFSKSFDYHKPDLIVVLGDRFEILAAVQAAMMLSIPIAHLHGGELTLGALDDKIRHAITKMAQLHFPVTQEYAKRIIQMGELPERVFNVGATAMDNIIQIEKLNQEELEDSLGITLKPPIFLLTWHPETSTELDSVMGVKLLLKAIKKFPNHQIIITKANADTGGNEINQYLETYVQNRPNYNLFSSLGNIRFLSLLNYTQVVIGNSSSALFEVAAMRVASVNIGNRQDGRYKPPSVIDCKTTTPEIIKAINTACSPTHQKICQEMQLPYGDGHTADKITRIIADTNLNNLNYKPFYDLEF